MNPETKKIQRGWYYIKEIKPDGSTSLQIQNHGTMGRLITYAPQFVPWATLFRLQSAIANSLDSQDINELFCSYITSEQENLWEQCEIHLNQESVLEIVSKTRMTEWIAEIRAKASFQSSGKSFLLLQHSQKSIAPTSQEPCRILFFESLMNSDMEYNDAEMSQGVLHMVSALEHQNVEISFAKVKMPIEGDDRPVTGLDDALEEVLCGGDSDLDLICITLLEGYWEGVVRLIQYIRSLGSRARIAIGGVMPTLSPEHVAIHMPEISFVCRGAGEYFLPKLVDILGKTSIDIPLNVEQLQQFASLDGLIVLDEAGDQRRLVCGRSDKVVQVEDLNRVSLNLQYIQARHLVGGVEICTSRGCIHKCTFCNIIGRESYQSRSSENIFELLQKYQQRYLQIFGSMEHIPSNCWRLHIADDDFACDKKRAAHFFRELQQKTNFRLSSVQVSVADLCLHRDGKLQPQLDPDICDAIVPECFADFYRQDLPKKDFWDDHKKRNWSSYLQIGVETFSDRELIRLGKGYRVEHIRTVVDGMAAKNIHVDAYFIQSNSETSAEDLLDGLEEMIRLKIRHPTYFHVRFPPVQHLVSYFPSATHRKHVRKGQEHVHKIRSWARVEGYPEYDYPFVDHDIPQDMWVQQAIENTFFTGENLYTKSIHNLYDIWKDFWYTLVDEKEKERGIRLLRRLDDLVRTIVFERLGELQHNSDASEWQKREAMEVATSILGRPRDWTVALQRFFSLGTQRLVLIPTWQCELRCRYCYIKKQDGRVMSVSTIQKSIDLLMSSRKKHLMLQFFGGEALLEWEHVKLAIEYATQQAKNFYKTIEFVISTNGWSITEEKLQWLQNYKVKLELSLDGDSETQNHSRQAFRKEQDSYQNSIATKTQMIQSMDFFYDVIMVVPPKMISKLSDNFIHIAQQGWRRIQINYALGMMWTKEEKQIFANELMKIGVFLRERWTEGDFVSLINLESDPMNMRLNGEITIDWDGTIHNGNAFLLKGRKAGELLLGQVDDLCNFDRYWLDVVDNDTLLDSTYSPEITKNNLEVGKILISFIKWMRKHGIANQQEQKMEHF